MAVVEGVEGVFWRLGEFSVSQTAQVELRSARV